VLDSLLAFTPKQKEARIKQIARHCKNDTFCIQQQYEEHIRDYRERYMKMYANGIMPTKLIRAAGDWQIKKAIPILKNVIGDENYDQSTVLMVLAKLGEDSIKNELINRYTLNYILENTALDTINNNNIYTSDMLQKECNIYTAIETAVYLESKEMLFNILDLIYIRGKLKFCIGLDCEDIPLVYYFITNMSPHYLRKFPNYNKLSDICYNYEQEISSFYNAKSKKEKKELERLLSTAYRTKIKEQIKQWIIENVNFE
jgi:uncharacterized protein